MFFEGSDLHEVDVLRLVKECLGGLEQLVCILLAVTELQTLARVLLAEARVGLVQRRHGLGQVILQELLHLLVLQLHLLLQTLHLTLSTGEKGGQGTGDRIQRYSLCTYI